VRPFPELAVAIDRERRRAVARDQCSGRYEAEARVAFDDGWQSLELPPFKTRLGGHLAQGDRAQRLPDIGFDRRSTCRGCEHGCVYCFARPTHAYSGRRLDFESKLLAKPDAPELLEKNWRRLVTSRA
jgi:hypothetical protein